MRAINQYMRTAIAAGFCAALAAASGPAAARPPVTTKATLLDRIQIEDMLIAYYNGFGQADDDGFAEYYLEDGVFVINGQTYEGREAITGLYETLGATDPFGGAVFHMLLTNLQIHVDGDTATASMLWTGVINPDPKARPVLFEQGRETDTLVKQGGVWYFKERVVTADSGLPEMFAAPEQP